MEAEERALRGSELGAIKTQPSVLVENHPLRLKVVVSSANVHVKLVRRAPPTPREDKAEDVIESETDQRQLQPVQQEGGDRQWEEPRATEPSREEQEELEKAEWRAVYESHRVNALDGRRGVGTGG